MIVSGKTTTESVTHFYVFWKEKKFTLFLASALWWSKISKCGQKRESSPNSNLSFSVRTVNNFSVKVPLEKDALVKNLWLNNYFLEISSVSKKDSSKVSEKCLQIFSRRFPSQPEGQRQKRRNGWTFHSFWSSRQKLEIPTSLKLVFLLMVNLHTQTYMSPYLRVWFHASVSESKILHFEMNFWMNNKLWNHFQQKPD